MRSSTSRGKRQSDALKPLRFADGRRYGMLSAVSMSGFISCCRDSLVPPKRRLHAKYWFILATHGLKCPGVLFRRTPSPRVFDYAALRSHFVTIVTENRQSAFTNPEIARTTVPSLLDLRENYRFNLYSYCLMPDHFHALIGSGDSGMTLGRICGHFKSLSTRHFWQVKEGKLWQRQFFDHVIRNEVDFWETVEYIRQNPVKKNLCKKWEREIREPISSVFRIVRFGHGPV